MDIKITEYGTVKYTEDSRTEEQSIKYFLKMLKSKINKKKIYTNENHNIVLEYNTFVDKIGENEYNVILDNDTYKIDITNSKEHFPMLKEKMDNFAKLSKQHRHAIDAINSVENNELYNSSIDNTNIYLQYLRKYKLKLSAIIAGWLSIDAIILGALISIYLISDNIGIGLICSLIASPPFAIFNVGLLDEPFSLSKILKLKIKKVKQILNREIEIESKTNTKEESLEAKTDVYKSSIINYMNTIMNGINKLNSDDRREKLLELRTILDDYMDKCQKLSLNKKSGLTLTDNERMIAVATLDKLTTLELEIADKLKHKNESNKVLSDGYDLKEKIDKFLEVVGNDEKDLSSHSKQIPTMQPSNRK